MKTVIYAKWITTQCLDEITNYPYSGWEGRHIFTFANLRVSCAKVATRLHAYTVSVMQRCQIQLMIPIPVGLLWIAYGEINSDRLLTDEVITHKHTTFVLQTATSLLIRIT